MNILEFWYSKDRRTPPHFLRKQIPIPSASPQEAVINFPSDLSLVASHPGYVFPSPDGHGVFILMEKDKTYLYDPSFGDGKVYPLGSFPNEEGLFDVMRLSGEIDPRFESFLQYLRDTVPFLRGYMYVNKLGETTPTLDVIDVPTSITAPKINFLQVAFGHY